MSWFVYVIRLDKNIFGVEERNNIILKLRKKGINCRSYFPPIHLEPFYAEMFLQKKGSFPITEKVSDLTIALPFYNNITEKQIEYICETLSSIVKEEKNKKL